MSTTEADAGLEERVIATWLIFNEPEWYQAFGTKIPVHYELVLDKRKKLRIQYFVNGHGFQTYEPPIAKNVAEKLYEETDLSELSAMVNGYDAVLEAIKDYEKSLNEKNKEKNSTT